MWNEICPLYIDISGRIYISQLGESLSNEIESGDAIYNGHWSDCDELPQYWKLRHLTLRLKSLLARHITTMSLQSFLVEDIEINRLPAPQSRP